MELLKTKKFPISWRSWGKLLDYRISLGDESLNITFEVIWNIHHKSIRQKGMNLLTTAKGEFGLWKMVEKIRTYGRRSDGGNNVGCDVFSNVAVCDVFSNVAVCDVFSNVAVCDVGLRSNNVALSCSSDIESERNNSSVDSSSSSVITNSAWILGLE